MDGVVPEVVVGTPRGGSVECPFNATSSVTSSVRIPQGFLRPALKLLRGFRISKPFKIFNAGRRNPWGILTLDVVLDVTLNEHLSGLLPGSKKPPRTPVKLGPVRLRTDPVSSTGNESSLDWIGPGSDSVASESGSGRSRIRSHHVEVESDRAGARIGSSLDQVDVG